MPAPPSSPRWGDLASQVANLFGLDTFRSPTLKATIERGVRYIHFDGDARELVFNTRALFLGLLSAGQEDRDSIRYGNTASWFATWLSERIKFTPQPLNEMMSEPEKVFAAVQQEFQITLSTSVRNLLGPARAIAQQTISRPEYEARHLLAAMIERGSIADQVREVFKTTLTPDDINDLKQTLIDRIMTTPETGETRENWQRALSLRSDSSSSDESGVTQATVSPPVTGIPNFSPDAIGRGSDVLETFADARALARLICLEDVAPLALAVFGGWGSGKSTFMGQIDQEVRQVLEKTAKRGKGTDSDIAHSARFIRRVVQIRFNAWQFVDANLWASLTAEFFDQLRAGGWDRIDNARHATLVERVNRHVHSLNTEVEATREAAIESGKDVLRAQQQRDEATRVARTAGSTALGQAAIDLLGDVYDSQKSNLSTLGLAVTGNDTSAAVDAILAAVTTSRSIFGQTLAVLNVVGKSPKRLSFMVAWLLFFGTVAWLSYPYATWGHIVAVLMAIGAAGTIFKALAPALSIVASVTKRSADIARAVDATEKTALKKVLQAELQLREASIEANAVQAAADLAAQRLSRYVDPKAASNPPRLLRYVLEDDPNTKALEAEVGLIGRTRRLFQAVNDIVREERSKADTKPTDMEVPDRIILYIDDLDRCTEQQVYAVLQAIHLLLAFELFVVIVAVDVDWVQTALSKSFANPTDANGVDRQRASRYLEKIFQIAFWLRPLSSNIADGGSFSRYVRTLAQPDSPPTSAKATPGVDDITPASQPAVERAPPSNIPENSSVAPTTGARETNTQIDQPGAALATIQLESVEVDFLASSAIADIAATTPRAVKRLVNIYRLVRARLSEGGDLILGDQVNPPNYPIIALTAAIETGQSAEVADAFYDGLSTYQESDSITAILESPFAMSPSLATSGLATAFEKCPGLRNAVKEVIRVCQRDLMIKDVLRVAQFTRRFSFNRYH